MALPPNPERILRMVRIGCPLVLLDDRKEREGDLFCAAAAATPEVLQFMVRRGSGLLCLAMPRSRLEEIGIPRISDGIQLIADVLYLKGHTFSYLAGLPDPNGHPLTPWVRFVCSLIANGHVADTPFHFPVDLAGHDSGISVVERLETIRALLKDDASIDWFITPGHLFTLGAHAEGMKGRWGHTEASIDLCRAAGLPPAGLLCECVGDDGNMLRGDDLEAFAAETSVEVLPLSAVPELLSRQAVVTPG